ncbi:sugar diacid recognition domain-containing protein [Planococcus sp. ISL-109]|uniref:CdaR family transcriptional regulator n=1 Tax=Planococcus sp. ISL-109 TaxID=2819166 RepID=UPI001BE584A3|nr:sugar diacid recognition domain-containing protein [Planococcus sp. ISL-109]MBT2583410.1 helix-turn-helix domain-containing protein [Planococcus sp. ISL-109]
MISKQVAEEIVAQTSKRLNRNLNVMDTNGLILASGEKERIDRIHEGAARVAATGHALAIQDHESEAFGGAKPGINLPIMFQDELVGVIGITGNPDELAEIAELVQLTTEMMVHQSLITSHTEWMRKTNELVYEELASGQPLSRFAKERLALLGMDNKAPYTVLLIDLGEMPSPDIRLIERLEDYFQQERALLGYSGLNELFVLLTGIDDLRKDSLMLELFRILQRPAARIGVGLPAQTISTIVRSAATASSALTFGRTAHHLVYYEDVELIALLKNNPQAELDRFHSRTLDSLSEELCRTLNAFFESNCSASEAAEQLGIHRHTLSYRLKKIEEKTGLNPANFQEAVHLYLALLLKNV